MKRSLLLIGVLWLAPVFAAQVVEDPLERQMLEIAKELRCAVCQNQPISESNADLARDMRQIIREQLKAGRSHDQIVHYFVERYGDYILLNPPTKGPGAAIWLLPVLLGAILAASAFVYLRRRRGQTSAPPPVLSKRDVDRVRAAREADRT